jgi:hypothetical protein
MPRPLEHFTYLCIVKLSTDAEMAMHLPAVRQAFRGLALAMTWNSEKGFRSYIANDTFALAAQLASAQCVVGLDLLAEYRLLLSYADFVGFEFRRECDLFALYPHVHHQCSTLPSLALGLGFLESLTDSEAKTMLWREGFQDAVEHFAKNDLIAMRKLHQHLSSRDKLELTFPSGKLLSGNIDHARHADVLLPPEYVCTDTILTLDE